MLKWILDHLGIVIFVVIFVSQIARALLQARKARTEHERRRDPSEEERRTRELQEQIRRQIAARRGQHPPSHEQPPPLPERAPPPPVPRPQTTQLPELFGGPLGRMLEELQKKVQPPPAPAAPAPAMAHRHAAEIERQQQLAEELRLAQETRHLAQRRAAHAAEDQQRLAQSEPSLRSAARDRLLGDLRDPNSIRRAFVLREVLGPPVGLR